MARFDVYGNPDGPGYLLDVQSDILEDLNTRVVVPLLPTDQAPTPAQRLNPVLEVDQIPVIMTTQFLAAIPAAELRQFVTSLAPARDEITSALDMLFVGF